MCGYNLVFQGIQDLLKVIGMVKVSEFNLEQGMPDVETAVRRLKNTLMTEKRKGIKAVIVIHGYGSSGVGGAIRTAVRKTLAEDQMKGLIRVSIYGETWAWRKKEALSVCKALEAYERRISGNEGVTVVILK
jgi:ribosomal protein S9